MTLTTLATVSAAMYDRYTKVVEAEFPRIRLHSTIPTGAPLAIVFDHFRLHRDRVSEFRQHVNLYFVPGTGMIKSIWRYHIKRLFEYSENNPDLPWQLVNCIALDHVNHGDSAVENAGVLGWEYDWREGSHDLIQVVKSLRLTGTNIAIGHSMGGFQTIYSTLISPQMFKFVIVFEPVTHGTELESEIFRKKIIPAVARVIQTEFKNEKEYETYMRKKSIFRKFKKEILDEFIETEKIVHRDGTVSMKTSKEAHIICYCAAALIFPQGLQFIRNSQTKIVSVYGELAKWTPKESVQQVKDIIESKPGSEFKMVPGAEHLLTAELPDLTIEKIIEILNDRVKKENIEKGKFDRKKYDETFKLNYNAVYGDVLLPKRGKL
ncbi:Peroxisomal membrane protein LPX1 [Cyberlindnera fabianii]|uniref:Peroxisomal membrane protein LPX1 n=1 Tax=Cyberlindnera fabianii TaxID=36022 RepID=A0A1V2LD23_CYBFA|nr:Peroxisomal membrane protein LPX1 [Cyberlindnera fabianii]